MRARIHMSMIAATLVMAVTLACAQPPVASQQGPGAGGPFIAGPFIGPPPFPGMMQPPVVVTTEKYLIIVRGNTVFQLDIDTLEILRQKELPMPQQPMPPVQPQPPRPQ